MSTTWQDSAPNSKGYSWWISLAILLSLLLHLVLFLVLRKVEVLQTIRSTQTEFQMPAREQHSVSEEILRELWREEQPVPDEKAPAKEKLLAEDEPEQLTDVEETLETIKLTPEIDKIQGMISAQDAPTIAETSMDAVSEEINFDTSESDAAAVKQRLQESAQVSAKQPQLMLQQNDIPVGVSSDEVVEELTSKIGGSKGAAIKGKFSSIDELIGRGQPIEGSEVAMFPTDLLFDFNEWTLKESAKLSLMKLGVLIVKYPNATFIIKGYTDSIGSDSDNLELSQKRADAVKNWVLTSLRLENYDLKAVGYGEADPLVEPSGDIVAESLNRRVEIEIVNKR